MSVVPYSAWVDFVEEVWRHHRLQPRCVLDLACGTANVLSELQQRGYEVTGVDASPSMIEMARLKCPAAELSQQDMRRFRLARQDFDACVCLFDSLNYLLTDADLRAAFVSVREHLRPGGLFVADMNSIRALEAGMFNQQGRDREGGLAYLWESRYEPSSRLCTIEMSFTVESPAEARTFRETHVQRGYTVAEIHGALAGAGLEAIALYDAFTFREPRARSDRYHVVARRLET